MLAARALGYAALGLGLALSVMLLTEEPFSTWPQRVARLCLFAPAVSALASGLSLSQARSRGELVALAALGASPQRVARGPSLAAWAVGLLAALLVASPAADLSAVFPAVRASAHWTVTELGFSDAQHGVLVDFERALRFVPGVVPATAGVRVQGLAGAIAVAPLALVLPVWVAAGIPPALRAVVVAVALGMLLVALHAVAAGRLGAAWLAAATLPLLLQAAVAYWRPA